MPLPQFPAISSRIPAQWLPRVRVAAIVLHWTAGNYNPSEDDKAHYHFLIDGEGRLIRGPRSIADNVPPLRNYAAHTRGFNAHQGKAVIGVSVCAMANAHEKPITANGTAPVKPIQMDVAARVIAQLCQFYGLTVTPQTVMMHGEVQRNMRKPQLGKWDINRLPYDLTLSPFQVWAGFRNETQRQLTILRTPAPSQPTGPQLYLAQIGQAPVIVPRARLLNGTWQVESSALAPLFPKERFLSAVTNGLRPQLAGIGYSINETMTEAHKYLNDPTNPRQIVYIFKNPA